MAQEENEIMGAYTVVFDDLVHLGPGDSATTRNLAEQLCADLPSWSRIADFGCGVGASALVLAQSLPKARVLAVDSHAPFITRLETAANAGGLGERVSAVVGDMADPPSLDGVMGGFDLIWSETLVKLLRAAPRSPPPVSKASESSSGSYRPDGRVRTGDQRLRLRWG